MFGCRPHFAIYSHNLHTTLQFRHATVNNRWSKNVWQRFLPPQTVASHNVTWRALAGNQAHT